MAVRRLNELSQQKDDASSLRYQQILRHMSSTLTGLTPMLKQEQWQLQSEQATIPLASLLRAIARTAGYIDQTASAFGRKSITMQMSAWAATLLKLSLCCWKS